MGLGRRKRSTRLSLHHHSVVQTNGSHAGQLLDDGPR